MKSSSILAAAAVLLTIPVVVGLSRAQDKTAKAAPHSRFEMFKALEGEWDGKGSSGGQDSDAKIIYHVTSAGSAVAETIDPGGSHEMITMITKDGSNLVLTHYCAAGNQPHMKASDTDNSNSVAFKFTGAGNMASEKDAHMHNATYTFVDKDTLKTVWTLYVDGKASETMTFVVKRKK
jgi:hypothetical protein